MYQQPFLLSNIALSMVQNSIDSVGQFIQTSLRKAPLTPRLILSQSLNKTRIAPLMARPYEVVNVTETKPIGTLPEIKAPAEEQG